MQYLCYGTVSMVKILTQVFSHKNCKLKKQNIHPEITRLMSKMIRNGLYLLQNQINRNCCKLQNCETLEQVSKRDRDLLHRKLSKSQASVTFTPSLNWEWPTQSSEFPVLVILFLMKHPAKQVLQSPGTDLVLQASQKSMGYQPHPTLYQLRIRDCDLEA